MKRLITALVGMPVVILLVILGNKYLMDVVISIIAMIAIHEYSDCIKEQANFISWVGYLAAICIAFIHVVPENIVTLALIIGGPIILFLLFLNVIITDMKISFKDAAFSFIGIMYIVGFTLFLSLLYGTHGEHNGRLLIWFVLSAAWGTDMFAYWTGKTIGKHKFSRVSPNKTIEGCIGGACGAVILSLICAYIMNKYAGMEIGYLKIILISLVLSVLGQVGDFSASLIKRYFGKKDFSELFPGHGGMIDRIDSIMFIAPAAYFLLLLL